MIWKKVKRLFARRPTEVVLAAVILAVSLVIAFSQLRETGNPIQAYDSSQLIGLDAKPQESVSSRMEPGFQPLQRLAD